MAKPREKTAPKTAPKGEGKRDRAYTVRYNETEGGDVERAAGQKSLEVASWIRMVSVEAARKQLGEPK